MWEAPFAAVAARLAVPGSKARARGALGVSEFKSVAHLVWPERRPEQKQKMLQQLRAPLHGSKSAHSLKRTPESNP